jgi:hypothetical protein
MAAESQPDKTSAVAHQKIEVKFGSGTVMVEQSELDDLIEALSEMRNLAADGRALMNIGYA